MFWIDKTECLQHGRKIITAGQKIPDDVPKEVIDELKKAGKIGTAPQVIESESTEKKLELAEKRNKALQEMLREKSAELVKATDNSEELEYANSIIDSLDDEKKWLMDIIDAIEPDWKPKKPRSKKK